MTRLHSPAPQAAPQPSVWVLDDSPGEAEAIRRALATGCCQPEVFTDGAVMIEALSRRPPPDLLVLDWQLPGLSGLEVCEFLRSTPATAMLPVLMLTANQRPEDVAAALTAGANDYVFKPFRAVELSARVLALARWDSQRREAERQGAEAHARTQRTLAEEHARRLEAEATLERALKAEAALRASEVRLRGIAETGIVGVLTWDTAGLINYANDAFLRMVGYSREDLEAGLLKFLELTPPEYQAVTEAAVRSLQETGVVHPFEKQYFRKDGSRVDILMSSATLDESRREGIALVLDITERKRAEAALRASEERNRAVLASLAEGIIFQDVHGVMRMVNASATQLLGYPAEQLIGRKSEDVPWKAMREDGAPFPVAGHPSMAALATGQPQFHKVMGVQRPDGSLVWLSVSSQLLFEADGRTPSGVVTSFFDITEHKRFQEEARRRADFERQLIGIVSHDLRTPLSAITLSASMLQRSTLEERQARNVERVLTAAGRASRLIRDLLDFTQARLGTGIPIHREPANLHALAQEAVDEVQPAWPDRRLELAHTGDGDGVWDADRIAQVLSNLVGNALHYGPPGTPVRVETRTDADTAVLSVHNAGDPIPPEVLTRIFEPLERGVAPLDVERRSIGLGLFIVDQVVRAHGGTIEVRSTAEAGTTFTVRLPRS